MQRASGGFDPPDVSGWNGGSGQGTPVAVRIPNPAGVLFCPSPSQRATEGDEGREKARIGQGFAAQLGQGQARELPKWRTIQPPGRGLFRVSGVNVAAS